jgi:hypothetical protein
MNIVLPDGMLVADSGTVAATQSASSAIVVVIELEHLASAFGIAVGEIDTRGAASAMASAVGSSMGVRRTG